MHSKKISSLACFLANKLPYTRTIITKLGLSKTISSILGSEPSEVDHYSDQYWNDIGIVQRYINENATGNPDTIWQIDILSRFAKHVPFKKCLVVGCGNGWVERQLYDLKIGLEFDAFDISDTYLSMAKEKRKDRSINYYKDDLNNLKHLQLNNYDAVFNVGVLHHGFRLAKVLWQLNQVLKPNGLMFNFDYVGPAQNNYSENHLRLLNDINKQLPKRFQSNHKLRPTKEDFDSGDPTEAVNADLVRPTFERFFDVVYQRNINGGIAYQILWNNISEFQKNDGDAKPWLARLLDYDRQYTRDNKVPVLFWYGVGTPKRKEDITHNEFLP